MLLLYRRLCVVITVDATSGTFANHYCWKVAAALLLVLVLCAADYLTRALALRSSRMQFSYR